MFRIVLATALAAAAASPALANRLAHSPAQVSAALKEGCTVQHVHTPSGKNVQSPALVWCDKRSPVAIAKARPTSEVQIAATN